MALHLQRLGELLDLHGFVAHRNAERCSQLRGDLVMVEFHRAVERVDLTVVWCGIGQDRRDHPRLVGSRNRGVAAVGER